MPSPLKKPETPGRRQRHGDKVRGGILDATLRLAGQHGLAGLSMGDLAKEAGISKSGLFAHFASKEELQLEVIDAARWRFVEEVLEPARESDRGLARLLALVDGWLASVERKGFRAASFFEALALEFDARPGPVRDAVVALVRAWLETLDVELEAAREQGALKGSCDLVQLRFELNAALHEASFLVQLLGDRRAVTRARDFVFRSLRAAATAAGAKILTRSR